MTFWRKTSIRILTAAVAAAALAVLAGCRDVSSPPAETVLSWDQVKTGISGPADSPEFVTAVISLVKTWKDHGDEGARLMAVKGVELIGLGLNDAVSGVSYMLGVQLAPNDDQPVARLLSSLSEPVKLSPDDWFRDVVSLSTLFGIGGRKDLQKLVDDADANSIEIAEGIRLCLARPLAEALVSAAGVPPSERGRVILEKLPGWPSPPTGEIMGTLFPANLSRISRWISEGRAKGGVYEKAWSNVAARLKSGFGGRVFDLPVVLSADPRPGTSLSAIPGRYMPLEVLHVTRDGVAVGLRPVLEWKDSFVAVASGDSTWPFRVEGGVETSLQRLKDAAAANAARADELEKAVYSGTAASGDVSAARTGGEVGRAILVAVDPDSAASTLVAAVDSLKQAGYTDFRLLTPGPAGSVNPFVVGSAPSGLADTPSLRVFLAETGAVLIPNPPSAVDTENPVPGMEFWGAGGGVKGIRVAWDRDRGFSGNLSLAFSRSGNASAGRVDVAEVVVVSDSVTGAMLIDAVSELQATPGVAFSRMEKSFPGLFCPQGRSCPGVVPVFGSSVRAPAGLK